MVFNIVASFDISKEVNKNGVVIEPRGEYLKLMQKCALLLVNPMSAPAILTFLTCSRPAPFKCSIQPRSAAHEKFIMEVAEHCFHRAIA